MQTTAEEFIKCEFKEIIKKPRHWEDCECLWCEAYRDHQR